MQSSRFVIGRSWVRLPLSAPLIDFLTSGFDIFNSPPCLLPPGSPISQISLVRSDERLSHGGGTFTDAMPAALAASTPMSVSSKTRQDVGSTPSRKAAVKKASGSGLPLL